MSAREPLDLDAVTADLDRALATWREIQNTHRPSLVTGYLICVEQTAELVPSLVRTATTLVAEVRALWDNLARMDASEMTLAAERDRLRAERDVLAGRLDGDAWERITRERDEARAEVERLTAQLDAVRALHTDSPAGVCPALPGGCDADGDAIFGAPKVLTAWAAAGHDDDVIRDALTEVYRRELLGGEPGA